MTTRQRTRLGWVLLAALSAAPGLSVTRAAMTAEDPAPQTSADRFRTLLPAVVNITARGENSDSDAGSAMVASEAPPEGRIKTVVGSGFIIDPTGIIVTNWHVVDGASEITVAFSDGSTTSATVLSATKVGDIALLKVDVGHPLSIAHWGDSDKLQIGDPVVAVGNPLGLGTSVSSGIVSALNRDIMDSPYDHFIQTDAAINHGNSGGPLFNMHGEVVGIDTAIVSPTAASAGLGFAIPARDAQFVVERMLKYGWVRPSWIGMVVQQITPDMAKALGMARPEGSIVAVTVAGGPAEKAGVRVGDVVLGYGDQVPTDERALLRMITETPDGQTTSLTVLRDGKKQLIPVTVAEWPRQLWEKNNGTKKPTPRHWTLPPDFGLTLSELTDQIRAQYGLDTGQAGVVITGVAAGTDAADRGLAPGDVILRVQDATVNSTVDVQSRLDEARNEKRSFALLLVLPKTKTRPGAKWVPLRVGPG